MYVFFGYFWFVDEGFGCFQEVVYEFFGQWMFFGVEFFGYYYGVIGFVDWGVIWFYYFYVEVFVDGL